MRDHRPWEREHFRTEAWRGGFDDGRPVQPLHPTMLDALTEAAGLQEGRGLTLLPDDDRQPPETRSYAELYREARDIAVALRANGVRRGDRVLIVMPTCLEFVSTLFAVQMLCAIPCPAYPPTTTRLETGLDLIAAVARCAEIKTCVATSRLTTVLGTLGVRAPSVHAILDVAELKREGATIRHDEPFRTSPDEPAFIQFTSGSTGTPKGVVLSHRNLIANIHAMGCALQIRSSDVGVSWCPLYHDMGIIGTVLFSIYWRMPLVLLSPLAFLRRPGRWLRAISDYGATMTTAPNFAYGLAVKRVPPEERAGLKLSQWRLAIVGAEPINARTLDDFEATYAPHGFCHESWMPAYGLAEATLAASFHRYGEPLQVRKVDRDALAQGRAVPVTADSGITLVSVGRPPPGMAARIIDEHGADVEDGAIGEVLVSGPSVMQGYFRDAERTASTLRDGWLFTGDRGFFADGELFITGRSKDMLIVQGRNYYAEDIERQAESVAGVRPGGAVAIGVYDEASARDRLHLVCETRLSTDEERNELVAQVMARVSESCELAVDAVHLVAPGTIPKTSSGKKQRSACREALLAGSLQPTSGGGKLTMARVFVGSAAGHVVMRLRRITARRTE